jgi:peroxiredoxin
MVYIKDDLRQINHEDSTVTIYTIEDQEKDSRIIQENMFISDSPISLLREGDWKYLSDTIVEGFQFSNFYLIEKDTVYDGKKVYVEKHIFINPKTALLEKYERRAFLNGEKSQFITFTYSDYELKKDPVDFTYEFPNNYISQVAGNRKKILPLEEGTEAPDFETRDMNGNLVQLSSLRGQKVLMNFSIINCGWCKVALDHLNQEDFDLPDDIHVYYVNPVDSKTQVEKYIQKFQVPFTVIPDAQAIGDSYRVNGYPTFYLIDEKGKIEKVSVGYSKEFISELGMK